MKRSKLRRKSKTPRALLLEEIQALLRAIVIKRDGGCLLRGYNNCTEILQAEHLITRTNMATYGDLRNVVCLCTYHHLFYKKQHSRMYWSLIRRKIGETRWAWIELAEADKSAHKVDLQLVKVVLQHELIHTLDKQNDGTMNGQ